MSNVTAELLQKYGFTYDHSQGYNDFTPFYARVGDEWTKIDYTKEAGEWMKPLVRGKEIDLVEIGANWYVDDLPPMMFIKGSPNSHGFVNPRDIEEMWRDQFDWVYANMDYAVFPFTIHPDVSGRPQVLLMLERLIELPQPARGRQVGDDGAGRRRLPPPPAVRGLAAASRSLAVCILCYGLTGEEHWTDARVGAEPTASVRATAPRAADPDRRRPRPRLQRRPERRSPRWSPTARASVQVARSLGEVWAAGEQLAKRPLDPLDPELLARLRARRRRRL